jgi:hypothetical protein
MVFEKLDFVIDKEDALFGPVSPNGPVDPPIAPATSPFSWAGVWVTTNEDGTTTESDVAGALEVSTDGKLACLRLPSDLEKVEFRVVCTASVDIADTTEIETISNIYHGAGKHSLATDLSGTGIGVLPKGAPLPV